MCCHLLWVIKLQQKADSCLSTKTNHWKYSSIMKHSIMVLSITQHHHDTMTPSHGEGGGEKDFVVSPWDHEISHGDNEIAHGLMVMVGKKSCPPPTKRESHGLMVRPWDISWWPWENSWSHRELAHGHHVVSHGEIVAAGSSCTFIKNQIHVHWTIIKTLFSIIIILNSYFASRIEN